MLNIQNIHNMQQKLLRDHDSTPYKAISTIPHAGPSNCLRYLDCSRLSHGTVMYEHMPIHMQKNNAVLIS